MAVAPIGYGEGGRQRELERQILHLLHRARNPEALRAVPLMESICERIGERDVLTALERTVREALPGEDRKTTTLRSVIFDVDFARAGTNGNAARRYQVSRRHFQRLRAQAVSAIARYARVLLKETELVDPAPESRRESLWRFESERAAYIEARNCGNALRMRAIAANMARMAENQEARILSIARLADAQLRLGSIEEAFESYRFLSPGCRLIVDVTGALLERDLVRADLAAKAALSTAPLWAEDRGALLVLESQIGVAAGVPWRCSAHTESLAAGCWERTALEAEQARHLLASSPKKALSLAQSTWSQAVASDYDGVAARSASVLCECARLQGDDANERHWRAKAIERLLRTGDVVSARMLFNPPAGERGDSVDAELCSALYERLLVILPQMHGESEAIREAVSDLLGRTVEAALAPECFGAAANAATERVASLDCAFAHYVSRLAAPVSEMLAIAVVGLTGRRWDAALGRVSELVGTISARLRPAIARIFPVGVRNLKKSQTAVADHLRVDELSGLRVRFVPVRSGTRGAVARRYRDSAAGTLSEAIASTDPR